jgi:hypothetical protein
VRFISWLLLTRGLENSGASPEVGSDGCTLGCNGSKGPREALYVDRGNASRELREEMA